VLFIVGECYFGRCMSVSKTTNNRVK